MKLLELKVETKDNWSIVANVELRDPSAVKIIDQQLQQYGELTWVVRAADPLASPTLTNEFVSYYIGYVGSAYPDRHKIQHANTPLMRIKKMLRRLGRHPEIRKITIHSPSSRFSSPESLEQTLQRGVRRLEVADVVRVV